MAIKTEMCSFSGRKVYPGHGITFIRGDGKIYLFLGSKCKNYFLNKYKATKITWTSIYRKIMKKK
jgi:large subunit ribosomal protein L24e